MTDAKWPDDPFFGFHDFQDDHGNIIKNKPSHQSHRPPERSGMNESFSKATQSLLFFLEEDASDEKANLLKNFISGMQGQRNWLHSPPAFTEINDDTSEHATKIIGGKLEILSFDNGNLPIELDRLTLHDVKFLLNEISALSRKASMEFEFELDQNFVGSMKNGQMDRCLSEAFLGEWEKSINAMQEAALNPRP